MRLITIDDYNEKTMQLARPVFDKQKRVLLAAGRTIHPTYLEKLKSMDIYYLFIEDAVSFGISMDEVLDMPTWIDGIGLLQQAFQSIDKKEEFPIREIGRLANLIVEETAKRKAVVLIPTTYLAEELRLYAHSVNVALLTIQLAKKKNYTPTQLRDLAVGALLHDIGKQLTHDYEQHPVAGFEFLRKIREVSLLSAHMSYQHHEAFNGSGFPRGLKEEQVHEFAQICAIANGYENALSQKNMAPHEAIEWIMTKNGTEFSMDLLTLFVQEVPMYTPGSKVLLNNGRLAIVTKVAASLQRPYVRYLDDNKEISLAENHTLLIVEVLKNEGSAQ
ncbi:HD-GYP domain-containing protein [Bacillus sp. CGMCC 1.16607]|uniref:HD-GYP domain-containing protein n=1 Tax=Bacillus sp. CGMCC 1.16607 TaxID=3351842 RepID=UPI003639CAC0